MAGLPAETGHWVDIFKGNPNIQALLAEVVGKPPAVRTSAHEIAIAALTELPHLRGITLVENLEPVAAGVMDEWVHEAFVAHAALGAASTSEADVSPSTSTHAHGSLPPVNKYLGEHEEPPQDIA